MSKCTPFVFAQNFRLHVHISQQNTFVLLAIKNMRISIISTYDEYQAKYASSITHLLYHYRPIYIHIVYSYILLLFLLPFTPIISIYVSACAYIKTHPTPSPFHAHTKKHYTTLCQVYTISK